MVKVKVEQGWLCGELLNRVPDDVQYYSFKGIPYAEPPVGKLRFKAPRPPLPWEGTRNATSHGPNCPQYCIFTDTLILGNEDCLYLNVYSPNIKPATPLPVMVFIHGGGFKSGSGDVDHYGPDFLVSHDVIHVTINYRLDALGFLCLDSEEVPGNAGLKDQVAALRWVKDNISNFGGDPNNVTIFGESAGGSATCLHVISPMSKGLFKRAISMSGVPFCDWSLPYHPQKRAFVLGKRLGLDTKDPQELLEFLQSLPVEQLINKLPHVLSFEENNDNVLKFFSFTPVIEKNIGNEHFLTEDPLEALLNKRVNDVDLMIGYTSQETLVVLKKLEASLLEDYNRFVDVVVPRRILMKCNPDRVLQIANKIHDYYFEGKPLTADIMPKFINYANDACFIYNINRFITHFPKVGNNKKYMYKLSCVSGRNVYGNYGTKYGIHGASHLDDLLYLMDAKIYNMKIEKNNKEYELVNQVCKVFTNFAKYGNPTPDSSLGATWPEYNNSTKSYVDIGDSLTVESEPDVDAVNFWRSIYEYAGLEY